MDVMGSSKHLRPEKKYYTYKVELFFIYTVGVESPLASLYA